MKSKALGHFVNEIEAAYAYDDAARAAYGEYAFPNFPEPATQVMRDQWKVEHEARQKIASAAHSERIKRQMAARPDKPCVCIVCGGNYTSRAQRASFYCSNKCYLRAQYRRRREEAQRDEVA